LDVSRVFVESAAVTRYHDFFDVELLLGLFDKHAADIECALVTINRRFVAVAVQRVFFESASVARDVFDWGVVAMTSGWSVTNQAVDAAKTRHFKVLDEVVATAAAILADERVQGGVAAMAGFDVFECRLGTQTIVCLVFGELVVLLGCVRRTIHLVERAQFIDWVNINHVVEIEERFGERFVAN
jgi:hypothetical protein